MLEKLKEKWKVNGWQFVLIITTFALGGSLTGWVGRKLLAFANMEHGVLYYILYLLLVTLLWPLAVVLVSIPLGQYPFFINYIKRILKKLTGRK
jgi:hypothetical protein